MNARAWTFTVAAGILLSSGTALGQSGGASSLPFFLEPLDPVQASLAGAGGARSGEAWALFRNPAALTGAGAQGQVAHAELEQGLRVECAALSLPLAPRVGVLSVGMAYAHLSGLEARDENGQLLADGFDYGASLLRLGYSRDLGAHFSAGVGAEYVRQTIAGSAASAWAAFAGLYARTARLDLSLAVDHLGTDLSGLGASQPLPRALRAGARFHVAPRLDLLGDWSRAEGSPGVAGGGVEVRPAGRLALRAGYRRDLEGVAARSGLGLGVGLGAGRWTADYSLTQDLGFSAVHRFGLTIALGAGAP